YKIVLTSGTMDSLQNKSYKTLQPGRCSPVSRANDLQDEITSSSYNKYFSLKTHLSFIHYVALTFRAAPTALT
ncbi:MAG: hypothetical protein KDJ28_12060, partial [Candidatus Competibacteraceae bacterium]|nr:hypothetical protein [Candidatus Competibacteraceae bacterium]